MFLAIAAYELRYRFRMLSTYLYFFIFLAVSFLIVCLAGGAFPGVNMNIGRGGDYIFFNGPTFIMTIFAIFMVFGTIIIAAVFGSSAVRDFESNAFALYFTKPVSKTSYVGGRFLGSSLTVMFIFSSISLGILLGTMMPFMEARNLGPNHLINYLQPYYYIVLPNLIFMGLAFFGTSLFTRRVMSAYIVALVMFVGYMLASVLMGDVVTNHYGSLVDPFGMSSWSYDTRYWPTADYNTRLMPFSGMLFFNRLLWLGLGLLGWTLLIQRFSFGWEQTLPRILLPRPKKTREMRPAADLSILNRVTIKPYDTLCQVWQLTRTEIRTLRHSPSFYVIAVMFLLFLIATASQVGKMFGTPTYPLTSKILLILQGNLTLFGMIVSTFYAGEFVWRERVLKMDQLVDVTPHHPIASFLAKFFTVAMMQIVMLALIMIVGIGAQIGMGFFRFEPGQYLFQLLMIDLPVMLTYSLAAFFFAVLMPNKYAGYLAMILFYALFMITPGLSLDHRLIIFNSAGGVEYSEMNGYGDYLPRFFIFRLYWGLFVFILTMIAVKFWPRGVETRIRERWHHIRQAGFDGQWKATTVMAAGFILTGGFIFYNTNILNEYHTSRYQEKAQIRFEKAFKRYENMAQPRITEVDLRVDMYPSQRRLDASGFYWLVNRTTQAIDTLFIDYSTDVKPTRIDFGRPATIMREDKEFGVRLYHLSEPLAPGDSLKMTFNVAYRSRGFTNDGPNRLIVENGTFVHSTILPQLGYSPNAELDSPAKRRKYHLPEKERMAKLEDLKARYNNYISNDADWVRYHAVVTTDGDQIAFAPGDMVRSWKEAGRYCAEFTTPQPILNFFAFLSGHWVRATSEWNGIAIEVYRDPKHDFNTKTMLEASRATLQYCSEKYRSYPNHVLRIVEVPYVYFAQSFPTIIPFSENIGFVARVNPKDPTDVDYPYYVTAHEIAHQWWAHAVIGGNVQGSTMFSEALAQYTSLMLMKHKYGRDRMRRFLTYESDSYLSGRSGEERGEQPLYRVENQQYIHYNKGSLVMYALQDDIGEEIVDSALSAFCSTHVYQAAPYPVSTDLLDCIRPVMPDSLAYKVDDLFTTITLFDNRIDAVTSTPSTDKKSYITTVNFTTEKWRCDGQGKETKVPMNENLEIALYAKDNEHPLTTMVTRVGDGHGTITLSTTTKPAQVVLDPLYKLIDKSPLNNEKDVE
jgi:hypothetical protein